MWISVAACKTPVGFHELWSMFEPDFSASAHTALPTPVLQGCSADLPHRAVRPWCFLSEPQGRQNEGTGQWAEKTLCWETELDICHEVRAHSNPPPQLYNELAVGKALAAPRGLCHKSCGSFLYRCVAVRMSKVVEASLLREETLPTEHSFPWMSGHFSGCSWGYWAH